MDNSESSHQSTGHRVAVTPITAPFSEHPSWPELQKRLSKVFPATTVPYAIPTNLVDAIRAEAADWFTPDELSVERDFATFCESFGGVGFIDYKPITFSALNPLPTTTLTPELFEQLGWDVLGSHENTSRNLEEASNRASPFRQQHAAYTAWLITNRLFLEEVNELRRSSANSALPPAPIPSGESDNFRRFCSRWQLSSMVSWELPLPQGPNISGVPFPQSVAAKDDGLQFSLPLTVKLPARFPLREVSDEARSTNLPAHLSEWGKILGQDGTSVAGVKRYADMMPLHFYRNIVLLSRYPSRFRGRVGKLDLAFARFSGDLGEDSVRKLRLQIAKRLTGRTK